MRNYFCYSSSLDPEAFRLWKKDHGYDFFELSGGERVWALSCKLVFNTPSNYWGGRVASLVETAEPEVRVEGILFQIEDPHWKIIEHKEGVLTGMSVPMSVRVLNSQGNEFTAISFVGHPSRVSSQGPVSRRFLEVLERAYKNWGLDFERLKKAAEL